MKCFRTYLLLVSLFFSEHVLSQDVHFSQYYFSPLSLNPANTGNYDGAYRFFGNYRSQWREISDTYNTYSAGADFNFFPSNVHTSAGFIFISDQSGGNLIVNKVMPSFAIHRSFAKFKVHLGVQPGVVFKSIDFSKNSFPNQLNWDIGSYDNTMPNLETGMSQRITYFDLNVGGGISRRFGKIEPEIGYAFFHVNEPKESFFDENNRLPIRQNGNMAITYYANRFLIFSGHSMFGFTKEVTNWVSGLTMEFVLNNNPLYRNSFFAGFMWRSGLERNPDAGIATLGFRFEQYTFGFSYDVTQSKLKTSVDSRGAFEIALIYKAFNTRLTVKELSCERY